MDVRAKMLVFPGFWPPWPKFWAGISAQSTPGCPRDVRPKNFLFGLIFRSWVSCQSVWNRWSRSNGEIKPLLSAGYKWSRSYKDQRNPRVRKIRVRDSGPEMAAPILWAPRISVFFLQEKLHVFLYKIPRFRGAGLGLGVWGGEVPIHFMGAGIFLILVSDPEKVGLSRNPCVSQQCPADGVWRLVARAIRNTIRANRFARAIRNWNPICIARQADSPESLEFPIRTNHAPFARIVRIDSRESRH